MHAANHIAYMSHVSGQDIRPLHSFVEYQGQHFAPALRRFELLLPHRIASHKISVFELPKTHRRGEKEERKRR